MSNPKIVITVLDEFSVKVDGELVAKCSTRLSKIWESLVILALTVNEPITNEDFMQFMWSDDISTNPQNALKNVIYCLRRDICEGRELDPSFVLFVGGQYRLNPEFDIRIDAYELIDLYNEANKLPLIDRKETLKNIIDLYGSGLVLHPTTYRYATIWHEKIKSYFVKSALELCEIYLLENKLNEIVALCNHVIKHDPINQDVYTYLFNALNSIEKYDTIINEYHHVTKLLNDKGLTPTATLTEIFEKARTNINPMEQDIVVIRAEIRAEINNSDISKKAYFCNYEVFKHMCNIKARDASRLNKQNALILITVTDNRVDTPDEFTMEEIKKIIASSLRKGDVFSKYSNSQFVLMMTTDAIDELNNAVMGRINTKFANTIKNSNIKLSSLFLQL